MTMDFSSMDILLDVAVLMALLECYVFTSPPTSSILEDHFNVTPSLNLDVQLENHLMLMMETSCPDHIF